MGTGIIHIRAGISLNVDELDVDTATDAAGAIATALAVRHGINGGQFTFKADGVVLEPGTVIPAGTNVLELVEIPAEPDEPTVEDPAAEVVAPQEFDDDEAAPQDL